MATVDTDGAVLLRTGFAVLGKILSGTGQVLFTKAELDKGYLPSDTGVEDLTAPCSYAGAATIAKCENTGTGEATVTVQASSIGVEQGFFITGVMLYVQDPVTKADVPYSYLALQKNPEWMRPENSSVGKLVTFSIVNIVSSATNVVAVISPDALARSEDLEALYSMVVSGYLTFLLADSDGSILCTDDYELLVADGKLVFA